MLQDWLRGRRRSAVDATVRSPTDNRDTTPPVPAKKPPRTVLVPSLASATREYARAISAGHFDRADGYELTRLYAAMGPDIWAWQLARRLTSQLPWRASPNRKAHHERALAHHMMTADIATWERALVARDAAAERARLFGTRPPEPLELPAAIKSLIEARRTAALARATRRRPRGDEGGSAGPTLVPKDAVGHPPLPSKPV